MSVEPASADPPRRRLRWYQFSLAAVLTMVAVLCAFLAYWARPPATRPPVPQVLLSDTDQQWRIELLKPTRMEFNETPLRDCVKYLQDVQSVSIQVDEAALAVANLTLDAPITAVVKSASLRSGLRQILRPLGLEYVVHDDVILITTQPAAERIQMTRVYPVHDLLKGSTDESLLQVITLELEAPDDTAPPAGAKSAPGAPAVPLPAVTLHRELLVLRGAYRHHERVQDLLDRLRLSFGAATSNAAQVQTGPKQPTP